LIMSIFNNSFEIYKLKIYRKENKIRLSIEGIKPPFFGLHMSNERKYSESKLFEEKPNMVCFLCFSSRVIVSI
jgi:hypothetical protein